MKALVTGAGGFVGTHLVSHLLAAGVETIAADLPAQLPLPTHSYLRKVPLDLLADDVEVMLADVQPDTIFHLAAQSYPNLSWEKPAYTFDVNVEGTLNLLEAVRKVCRTARVVVVTSSAVYAPREVSEPITEDSALDPVTPYGISKLAQDYIAKLYAERYALWIARARPFYLIGPGKVGDVCSDIARGIVRIERGLAQELVLGNLEVVRDFLDVRDGVSALVCIASQGCPGEVYNVSSGRGIKIAELVNMFARYAKVPVRICVSPERIRPLDEPVKIASNERLRNLGWSPTRPVEETVREILDFWRKAEGGV